MSQTTVNLGYVPKNRGEYSSTASYYKDNIVQYNGSSYICNPPNYDPDTAPTASITGVAPYASDPAVPNTGWAVFSNDSSGVGEGVYDVSVDHTTDNQPKKYADLSAALQDVPQAKHKGGMTIRFIQSSDNKYIQARLMADEFTTDTTQWAIAEEGVYVENPEYVYVKTDAEGKILWAIKTDGGIYYGAGCPQQVKDYIEEKISSLSLDEYEDIVTFLSDYLGSYTTLKEMIDGINAQIATKLNAEGLDPNALDTVQSVDNPEYIQVTTDSEDKILEGITSEGVKQIDIPIDTPSVAIEHINNNEYMSIETDEDGKVISGRSKDGVLIENVGIKTKEINTELLNISKEGLLKFQKDLLLNIETNEKKQEFSSLFKYSEGEVASLVFFSDPHWFQSYDECRIEEKGLTHLKTIKDIFDNTPTDFVMCGGDWLQQHKQSTAIKDLGWIDGFMNSLFPTKYYPIYGNHDNNYQGELDDTSNSNANDGALSNQQMINLWFRKYGKMYYTFKEGCTKFFIFDTGIDWVRAMDDYKWEQVDWFAKELLANKEQHLIIALHIVTYSGAVFGENITPITDNILKVANAFNNRTSITLNGDTYDFSNSEGTVHATLCGHTHYDAMATINNIPVYCIKNATNGDFDILLIDYAAHKLKSIRIGEGNNREMNIL